MYAMDWQNTEHKFNSSKDTHATASASAPAQRRIIQNSLLIWLDANIDESSDDFHNSMTQLRRSVNTIDTFTNSGQCIDYLTRIKDEKAVMIVPGYLGQLVVPRVHDMTQLSAIFVSCSDKPRHEQWAKQWSKVKGVFTEIGPICESLKQTMRQCDQNTIPVSFVSTAEVSSDNLDQLDQSFMYTQILKEILFDLDCDKQFIANFIAYCREQYAEDDSELNNITKFEREYRDKSPIWWYTYECFLYPMLNRALGTQELGTIIKMGFYIRDLHQHITELHAQQFEGQQTQPFIVYLGQGLSTCDFEKLTKTRGGLMSFNNFLSTSKDREISLDFATRAAMNPEQVGILFTMMIDPSISKAAFAGIQGVSYYQSEEILFSMHTIFRIDDFRKLDKRLWQVDLRLTSDNDPLLSRLTEMIQEETKGSSGWYRLGMLLFKLGKVDKAEEVYRVLLDQPTPNESETGTYYHQLGLMKGEQGSYTEAISFYKKGLEIYQKTLPSNHPWLATSYTSFGWVYDNMGEYSKALFFYEKALEIYQKTFPPNHTDLATSYNNIGSVYYNMGENSKAASSHEKALEIYQNTLPPDHPDLATSYSNIGSVYYNMGEYSKALSSHEKALAICEKILPPDHPDLSTSYSNIGQVYNNMGEYSKAVSFYEKLLEICEKTLPPNHPDLATSYSNIGSMYYNMGEHSKALSSHEKALEIYQTTLPPNHLDLAGSYNNIGLVYKTMGEYPEALSFYEKTRQIFEETLPPNHPSLATCYNNIGLVYDDMGEYSKVLSFCEKDLEICENTLPPNHPSLATSYNNIGSVYYRLEEYSKALEFFERALEIWECSLSPNHPNIQTVRDWLELARNKL